MKLFSYNSIKLTLLLSIIDLSVTSVLFTSIGNIVTDDKRTMLINLAFVAVLGIFMALFGFLFKRSKANAISNISMDIHQKITKKILNTSLTEFNKKDSGDYISLYSNDSVEVIEKNVKSYLTFFENLFTIIFFGIALFTIHYGIFLVSIVTLGLSFIMPKIFEKKYASLITKTQDEKGVFLNKTRELVQGFSTLVENNKLSIFDTKERLASQKFNKEQLKQSTFIAFMEAILNFTSIVTFILSTLSIAYLIYRGYVSTGVLVSGALIMSNFNNAVMAAMSDLTTYKSSFNFIKEKLPILLEKDNETTFVKPFFNAKNIFNTTLSFDKKATELSSIKLRNIRTNFGDKKLAFDDFDFEYGKKYAIVGKSGSGKSTLLKILTGEIQNYDGEVLLDNRVKQKEETLFNSISYCSQQTYLFNDSIEKNITFDKSDKKVNELLELLNLEEFSSEHYVEENGKNLSGGQRQRLGLARALYSNHNILILDEATSALDKETRKKIENYILTLDKTIIMISHHLDADNEKLFDKIYQI